ncbi:pilin [Entomomonas asaccharolytica]|uniref:Pilin n=1 Tax=Entomomonas asaccharolytica TaxID=2785331 RepID=A0A974NE53_9GAMM|nr:pilin [Entomomonas asaccharolytica]QQP84878.1 pilin [Entomomonas asaccharolytica]
MEPKENTQTIDIKKQRIVVVKVIVAMTLFLLGIPFLLFLGTTYYTNKGLMMDVYLMGQEYTQQVTDFYNQQNKCPTNQDIITTVTEKDMAQTIDFTSAATENTCIITLTVKTLGISLDDKQLVLSKTFNQTNNTDWQCASNASSLYLPAMCNPIPSE